MNQSTLQDYIEQVKKIITKNPTDLNQFLNEVTHYTYSTNGLKQKEFIMELRDGAINTLYEQLLLHIKNIPSATITEKEITEILSDLMYARDIQPIGELWNDFLNDPYPQTVSKKHHEILKLIKTKPTSLNDQKIIHDYIDQLTHSNETYSEQIFYKPIFGTNGILGKNLLSEKFIKEIIDAIFVSEYPLDRDTLFLLAKKPAKNNDYETLLLLENSFTSFDNYGNSLLRMALDTRNSDLAEWLVSRTDSDIINIQRFQFTTTSTDWPTNLPIGSCINAIDYAKNLHPTKSLKNSTMQILQSIKEKRMLVKSLPIHTLNTEKQNVAL